MTQVSGPEAEDEVARFRRELAEALERQVATDEVLRVIASTPGELAPVFEAILANGTRSDRSCRSFCSCRSVIYRNHQRIEDRECAGADHSFLHAPICRADEV